MLNLKTIIFLIFCPFFLNGQNIIPNASFEDTLLKQTPLYLPSKWISPTKGSPDYMTTFNQNNRNSPENFAGFQNAKSGVAYMGLLIYTLYPPNDSKRFREYFQNKFTTVLKKDSNYCLQLYVSLADSFRYASRNKLGVYFSQNKIGSNDFFYLPFQPQIMVSPDTFITEKKNWVEYNFEYQAQGGEKYITIGNFTDSTEIDTLLVGGGDPNNQQFLGTYYYIDDVYLGHCDSIPIDTPTSITENSLSSKLKGYPNPVTDLFVLENNSKQALTFQLYNLMGQSVVLTDGASRLRSTTHFRSTPHQYELSMGHLPKGIYLLQVVGRNERATMKLVKE